MHWAEDRNTRIADATNGTTMPNDKFIRDLGGGPSRGTA